MNNSLQAKLERAKSL